MYRETSDVDDTAVHDQLEHVKHAVLVFGRFELCVPPTLFDGNARDIENKQKAKKKRRTNELYNITHKTDLNARVHKSENKKKRRIVI